MSLSDEESNRFREKGENGELDDELKDELKDLNDSISPRTTKLYKTITISLSFSYDNL